MTWLVSLLLALSGLPTAAPPQPAPSVSASIGASPLLHAPARVDSTALAGGAPALSGIASWYNAPTIHDAAAGPPLRVGNWRGRLVTVRYGSRSVVLRLTDWCQCPRRLIDVDDQAFKQLAPLSKGLLKVTVTFGGPALPATDTAP